MATVYTVLIAIVAALHVFFFVLEAFLWTKPFGRKVFRLDPDFAEKSAALAKNQGVYNLFLAAGLVWSLMLADAPHAPAIATFFLMCVLVAGLVGALTVNPRIFVVQGLPALAALLVGLTLRAA
jgi:putative membrane protein